VEEKETVEQKVDHVPLSFFQVGGWDSGRHSSEFFLLIIVQIAVVLRCFVNVLLNEAEAEVEQILFLEREPPA
jgi:hypothetical protein